MAAADLAAGWALLGCGLVAWGRRPASGAGPLLALTGATWFLGSFAPALVFLHRGPLVHLLLAYPALWPARTRDRALVALAYVDGAIEPLGASPAATLALCAALAVAAVGGYVQESGPRRRARAVPVAGAVAVAVVLGASALVRIAGWNAETAALIAYEAVLAALAAALLADLLRGRWSLPAVTGLVVDLGGSWQPVTLRDRLARAIGDPSLQLGYRLAAGQPYVDEAGRPFALPGAGSGRAVTPVAGDGGQVAVLVHDPATLDDPALADAVATATRIAVENVRLQAEVADRVEQLAASRRRIVEAADAQRRRLQGELERGAGERLAAVARLVGDVSVDPAEARAHELLGAVEEQLGAARSELAELARGIHPTALASGGLASALPELARRATIPVDVSVDAGRCSAAVEAAAYFVCAEALANVAKYARAARGTVAVERREGLLVVSVADDGVGGADPERGSGLRGLADRVEALGGRLSVESPDGAGTRLRAELPAP
jgi:signal transduction histidine kinase